MSHGKICYIEIPAITGEASAAFYGTIFSFAVFADPAGTEFGLYEEPVQ